MRSIQRPMEMPIPWKPVLLCAFVAALGAALFLGRGTLWAWYRTGELRWPRSVDDVLDEHLPTVEARFRPEVEAAGLTWPPAELTLLAFKSEALVEVWIEDGDARHHLVDYPVLGQSGVLGPKRREGDRQVPEGVYDLTTLNPQSWFHLSVRVDYPNEHDRAALTGDLGGDIYVHGGSASIGCLAMGDAAIEELFVLAAIAGERRIVIAPVDLRYRQMPEESVPPEPWTRNKYSRIRLGLDRYK